MSTWVFSDIHGNRKLFNQVMDAIGSEDRAFFLGDAIDRGADGWAIFKESKTSCRIIEIKIIEVLTYRLVFTIIK